MINRQHVAIAKRRVIDEGEINEVRARWRGADRGIGIGPEQDFCEMGGEQNASRGDDDDGVAQELWGARAASRRRRESDRPSL